MRQRCKERRKDLTHRSQRKSTEGTEKRRALQRLGIGDSLQVAPLSAGANAARKKKAPLGRMTEKRNPRTQEDGLPQDMAGSRHTGVVAAIRFVF